MYQCNCNYESATNHYISCCSIHQLVTCFNNWNYATINPKATKNTIVWYKNGNVVSYATANVLGNFNVDHLGSYTARVSTAAGCATLLAPVVIKDSATDKLYILPNPNNGRFKIRYYTSVSFVRSQKTITIYNGKVANVYSTSVTTTAAYCMIDVNITNAGKGIFLVVISNSYARAITTGKVVVQ